MFAAGQVHQVEHLTHGCAVVGAQHGRGEMVAGLVQEDGAVTLVQIDAYQPLAACAVRSGHRLGRHQEGPVVREGGFRAQTAPEVEAHGLAGLWLLLGQVKSGEDRRR